MDLKLRNVWSHVLDVDDSDLDEDTNFFESGGDSVAALRLVAAARDVNLSVEIEDVFNSPTLGGLAEKCQEASPASKPKGTASEVSILDQDTVGACATACQVEPETIEDIFPASPVQSLIFEAGKSYGTYVMQWVFQICGQVDSSLLIEAWDRLQKKHQILRTRLVKVGIDHFQVVLQSDMEWQEGKDLAQYKRQSLRQRVAYGRPLFRYAVIKEEEDSYFVWTAHHAGFDGWTRRMIFKHLQESLSQPLEYAKRPDGTGFKNLISWSQRRQKVASSRYWKSAFEGFKGSGCVFPLSLQSIPTTTSILSKSWSRGSANKSKFTMAAVAHAALAISFGNMSGLSDISFTITRSGRYDPIPGVESIFGPMLIVVPLRTKFLKEQSLEDYIRSMQNQLVSMTPHERDGHAIARELLGSSQLRQAYLSWHALGDDVLSKDLPFKNRAGLPARLKPRRDLSTQFAANYGLVLNVYEREDSLDLYISWDDSLRSQSDIEQLMADLIHNLDQLVGSNHLSVGDLWLGKEPKWVY